MNKFSNNLRKLMDEKKFTGESLGNLIGVSPATVIHWANGRRFPKNEDYIKKIAKILKVKVSELFGDEIDVKKIPLIGPASCGIPNMVFNDNIEDIPVSNELARDGVYAVIADGDSMLPDIKNGDIIICDKEIPCENGNIVHYTTIDGESGLKKYLADDNGVVTLMPLNSNFKPIMCDEKDLRCARAFKKMSDL